ncbi:alpha/beta fold hydrolase [Nocardia sp. NPDC127579]|uniref:alpha/beta fold hydrolase n=1 Tax=Nocardia sp. NPDC127579 TaxID=3345402 RepID=UPI00363A07A7
MIEANGLKFHLVEAGAGDLVVLLHGFPQFWYTWRHQIPVLAKHFRVVAVDMRGYGRSDKPLRVADYGLEFLADDVAALIRALGAPRAHVVGHDWGGIVAWATARYHPDIVDHLALSNCPHPVGFAKALRSNPRQICRSWYMFLCQIPRLPELVLRRWSAAVVRVMFRDMTIRAGTFTDQDIEEYRRNLLEPGAATAMIHYYRALLRGLGRLSRSPAVGAPTAVIWAENDVALGLELARDMGDYFSGPYRIHYIPDCSHWVNEEQPEMVNRLLLEHLGATSTQRTEEL